MQRLQLNAVLLQWTTTASHTLKAERWLQPREEPQGKGHWSLCWREMRPCKDARRSLMANPPGTHGLCTDLFSAVSAVPWQHRGTARGQVSAAAWWSNAPLCCRFPARPQSITNLGPGLERQGPALHSQNVGAAATVRLRELSTPTAAQPPWLLASPRAQTQPRGLGLSPFLKWPESGSLPLYNRAATPWGYKKESSLGKMA